MKFNIKYNIKLVLYILLFLTGFVFLFFIANKPTQKTSCSCSKNKIQIEGFRDFDTSLNQQSSLDSSSCPNILIRRGDNILLYNKNSSSIQPLVFHTMEEYETYAAANLGKQCPILAIQEESNTQGESTYRAYGYNLPKKQYRDNNIQPNPPPFSLENQSTVYPGFDPYGLNIGKFTELDKIHDSTLTENGPKSLNPMDVNWSGNKDTENAIEHGKYKEDAPDKCKLNIAKSTAAPECAATELNGGYTVHPVPAPTSTKTELNNNNIDGGNNQKLILFNLGNAISGAPIIIGTIQLPKPPINTGITIKKIIKNAWPVTTTLYN